MMYINIFLSDKLKVPNLEHFAKFLRSLASRRDQGYARYGPPNKAKKYMSRLTAELKAYKKTGNQEHLLNIAVYCWLESLEPENKKFHFDPEVGSATRSKYE